MCEGSLEETDRNRRETRIIRSSDGALNDHNGQQDDPPAFENPPPVASRSNNLSNLRWKQRNLSVVTTQLLKTFRLDDTETICSSAVTMEIVNEKYLVVGTNLESIVVWTLLTDCYDLSDETSSTSPPLVVSLNTRNGVANARIVCICLCTDSQFVHIPDADMAKEDLTVNVLAASDLGDISIVNIILGTILFQFNTGTCSLTCIQITRTPCPMILVGYQTGVLECWRLSNGLEIESSDSKRTPSSKRLKANLIVHGSMASGHTIRSLICLKTFEDDEVLTLPSTAIACCDPNGIAPTEPLTSNEIGEESIHNDQAEIGYVMLTLDVERQSSTSNMVEVIDLTSLATAHINQSNALAASILLEDHRILPVAGMELIDISGLSPYPLPMRTPFISSPDTNQIVNLPEYTNDCHLSCAFGLSDGTVGIASVWKTEDGCMSWGIARASDQLLLSYPCIGLNTVTLNADSSNSCATPNLHLACCLRGGSVYLVPLNGESNPKESSIKVMLYPNDLDADVNVVHRVQSFTAGNIRCRESNIPVVIYAWPGGILELYACYCQSQSSCPISFLEQLHENGSVQLLYELLLSSNENVGSSSELPYGHLWEAAKAEVLSHHSQSNGKADDSAVDVDHLASNAFQAFRAVLLQLSTPDAS